MIPQPQRESFGHVCFNAARDRFAGHVDCNGRGVPVVIKNAKPSTLRALTPYLDKAAKQFPLLEQRGLSHIYSKHIDEDEIERDARVLVVLPCRKCEVGFKAGMADDKDLYIFAVFDKNFTLEDAPIFKLYSKSVSQI